MRLLAENGLKLSCRVGEPLSTPTTSVPLALLVLLALGWAAHNASGALARRNINVDFGFLLRPAGFDIPFHLAPWQTSDTYGHALFVAGLFVHGPGGGGFLALTDIVLIALTGAAWSQVQPKARPFRVVVIVAIAALAIVKLTGHA